MACTLDAESTKAPRAPEADVVNFIIPILKCEDSALNPRI
jgi:hypothetical protein